MVRSPQNRDTAASVGEVISDPDHTLSALFSHAKYLARAESILTDHAGPEMAAQFQVAAIREDRLVLLTPTASWATRLRMQAEQLLQFLHASGYEHLRHIDIRVAPLVRKPIGKKVRRKLSPAAELAFKLMYPLSINSSDDSEN